MKTLVVYCHPRSESFTRAVLDTTLAALRAADHEVRLTDLYADGFEPVVHASREPDDESLTRHIEDLLWCESLVLVYPTWWAAQPAMLKGWIDRVWVEEVAFGSPRRSGNVRPLLRNVRRITAVTTHGSSKFVNALEGESGKRTMTRALRVMCSRRCRTRWIALYNIDRATTEQRQAFLRRVSRLLGR